MRMRSLVLLLLLIPAFAEGQNLEPREIAARARPAVVLVQALDGDRTIGQGSGFLVTGDGRLITSRHVIEGARTLRVQLASGEIYDRVFFVSDDERRDLAVLRIPASGTPALPLGDDRAAAVGDAVYVMGNPMGLEGTFSHGLISAQRMVDGVALIQISAPISRGSSGGPVLNARGEVVGVATLTLREGQNLNMAVPTRYATGLLSIQEAPVPFERVASRFARPDGSTAASATSHADEEADEMPDWMRVLAAEMVLVDSVARSFDLVATHDPFLKVINEGQTHSIEFDFDESAGSIMIVGVCDLDCDDLDLAVYDGRGRLVQEDVEVDDRPNVMFRVVQSGTFEVRVSMASCSTGQCGFAVQAYASPRR